MVSSQTRHIIPVGAPSQRLDRYLAALLPEHSRTRIQRWITEEHIRLNGEPVRASHPVAAGEEITITIPPEAPLDMKPEPIPLSIVYEDESLLVVDKPAGLVTHPAPGHPSGTLVNALLHHGSQLSSLAGPFKPGIVHRLDKETSGLLVVAKDDAAHRELSQQFASRKVKRVYLAMVQGRMSQDEGTIQVPIGRHPRDRKKMAVRLTGKSKEAITRYRVVKRFSAVTVLTLYPQTGRTHQLRVHLAHMGHPILGDVRYGAKAGFPRQALHAHRLGFVHPTSGRFIELISPLPEDLERFLKTLASKK